MKIAIIGAGVAGLASARYAITNDFECDVFEMTDQIGGTWVYTDDTGTDKYGYPVHSAMYKNLRTNIPKEAMGFLDFAMPELKRSFITHEEVLDFLKSFTDHFKLRRVIKFNTIVKEVIPFENNSWKVTYVNKPSKEQVTKIYDAVMVCNGHYSKARIPDIEGQKTFTGDVRHSKLYRSSAPYKNKRVLVIGAGPSGVDITMQLMTVAKSVVLSHHMPKPVNLENVENKPVVRCIKDSQTVEFVDGSTCEVDAIIFCTGYYYNYPFLHESCGITVKDNRVQPLYKHLINIDKPTMCIMGVLYHVCPFPLVDLQARYFCKFLKGYFKLPSVQEMQMHTERDIQDRQAKGFPKTAAHRMGDEYEQTYFKQLSDEALVTPIPPVARYFYKFLNGSLKLPSSEEMRIQEEKELAMRMAKGYSKKASHCLGDDFEAAYFEDLAIQAQLIPFPPVIFKLRTRTSKNRQRNLLTFRDYNFKIIGNDNFVETIDI